jgi:hypothetical protein
LARACAKSIDSATRTRDFVDYHEAGGWAAEVDTVLDSIAGLASGARAGLAIELAERAVDRIAEAIEQIDDSDGHCTTLLARACDIHLAAVREVRPEPIRLARDLFAREMADQYGTFGGRSRFTPTRWVRPGSPNIAASPPMPGRKFPRIPVAGCRRRRASSSAIRGS